MDLVQLRNFIVIAKEQNITKSANLLHLSQPALSGSLSKLESEIGIQLFDRVGKRIILNQYGEIFLTCAESVVNSIDLALAEINQLCDNKRTVSLSVTSPRFLQNLISDFTISYPEITVRKHEIMPINAESEISSNDNDFVLADWYPGFCPNAKYQIIHEEKLLLAMCKQHPLASKEDISLSDIRSERFIALPKGYAFRTITDHLCAEAGFECDVIKECFHCHLLSYVHDSLGIAFVDGDMYNCDSPSSLQDIVFKDLSDGPMRYLALFWYRHRELTRSARLFLNYASKYYRH